MLQPACVCSSRHTASEYGLSGLELSHPDKLTVFSVEPSCWICY
jgi:hypothetical protein